MRKYQHWFDETEPLMKHDRAEAAPYKLLSFRTPFLIVYSTPASESVEESNLHLGAFS